MWRFNMYAVVALLRVQLNKSNKKWEKKKRRENRIFFFRFTRCFLLLLLLPLLHYYYKMACVWWMCELCDIHDCSCSRSSSPSIKQAAKQFYTKITHILLLFNRALNAIWTRARAPQKYALRCVSWCTLRTQTYIQSDAVAETEMMDNKMNK